MKREEVFFEDLAALMDEQFQRWVDENYARHLDKGGYGKSIALNAEVVE